jgi:hypothetical protein
MPRQAAWLTRLPQILNDLRHFPAPVIDRSVVEQLFCVSRRRAQQLLAGFGGYQSGKTYLVERTCLIEALESLAAREPYRAEHRRQVRLASHLDALRRDHTARAVVIPTAAAAAIGERVEFRSGELVIRYQTPEECLETLWRLAQSIAGDYEGFVNRITG